MEQEQHQTKLGVMLPELPLKLQPVPRLGRAAAQWTLRGAGAQLVGCCKWGPTPGLCVHEPGRPFSPLHILVVSREQHRLL